MPGIVIAGTHSGCGKTTITLGILAALKGKGLTVQSFKAGPDFIDAGLHRIITDRPSRNLDLWMCGEDYVKHCFERYSEDADLSIVEGVMGLYDGELSTARLAIVLNQPIILVVDAYGMAESAGAVVKGFINYHPLLLPHFKGVIFNRVGSERHYERLKNSVSDIEALGYLPRDLSFQIPHRHLGLTVAEENPLANENIDRLAETVMKYINVEAIGGRNDSMSLKQGGDCPGNLSFSPLLKKGRMGFVESGSSQKSDLKIAVAYDKAFCFYYEDNLDLLREAGAEIITFSPISDKRIPYEADALYIGGGYPELYARELSENKSMIESIRASSMSGMPIYAECGGLIYLSEGIYDLNEDFYKMAGIFSFATRMRKRMARLGYREIELEDDSIVGEKGDRIRGHEFHYSEIFQPSAFNLKPFYRFKNTYASYVHVHFGSNLEIAKNFVRFIKESRWKT